MCNVYLKRMFYGSQLIITMRFKKGCRKIDYILLLLLYNYIYVLQLYYTIGANESIIICFI